MVSTEPELSMTCEGRKMRVCIRGLHPASTPPPTPPCAEEVSGRAEGGGVGGAKRGVDEDFDYEVSKSTWN